MILVLLGATGLIAYLPVPMLTAIVISSLLGQRNLIWLYV